MRCCATLLGRCVQARTASCSGPSTVGRARCGGNFVRTALWHFGRLFLHCRECDQSRDADLFADRRRAVGGVQVVLGAVATRVARSSTTRMSGPLKEIGLTATGVRAAADSAQPEVLPLAARARWAGRRTGRLRRARVSRSLTARQALSRAGIAGASILRPATRGDGARCPPPLPPPRACPVSDLNTPRPRRGSGGPCSFRAARLSRPRRPAVPRIPPRVGMIRGGGGVPDAQAGPISGERTRR